MDDTLERATVEDRLIVALATELVNKRPELKGRVASALAIIKARGIIEVGVREYLVQSQSEAGTQYRVNGTCNCPNANPDENACVWIPPAPGGWCKHRIAAYLRTTAHGLDDWAVEESAEAIVEVEQKFVHLCEQHDTLLARRRALLSQPSPAPTCPDCNSVLESIQQYIGRRGYLHFSRCSHNPHHYAEVTA